MSTMITETAKGKMYVETCEELQYKTWLNPERGNRRQKRSAVKYPMSWVYVLFQLHKNGNEDVR